MPTPTRLYGRKNFTVKKIVKTILDRYEKPSGRLKGATRFEGLPFGAAAQLLDELPIEQGDDRATDTAPTFSEMLNFVGTIEGVRLMGVRVHPESESERITLTGFTVPFERLDLDTMNRIIARGADAKITWVRDTATAILRVKW